MEERGSKKTNGNWKYDCSERKGYSGGQLIKSRIRDGRYNKRYKEIGMEIKSASYLRRKILDVEGIGDKMRALLRLRCGKRKYEKRK